MPHRLRWDDLQIVLGVAEHRSLSGAARDLGLNHSTVLRRLDMLEKRLGMQLFERPPGGYRLRAEAMDLLAPLRGIGETVGRVERALLASRRGIEGPFRITTTDSVAELILPRHIRALQQTHPNLQIEMIVSNAAVDMARPAAEITVRPARALPPDLIGRRGGDMAFEVFGSPAYLVENPSNDVSAHRWLGVSPLLARSPVATWQERRLPAPPAMIADSFLTLAQLAAEELGLAMLPSFVGRRIGGLARAEAFPDREVTGIWVASHPALARLPHIVALVDFFIDALAADGPVLG